MPEKLLIGYVIDDEPYCTDEKCIPKGVELDEATPLYDSDHWMPWGGLRCRSCRKMIKDR